MTDRLTQDALCLAKVEVTAGTDPTPAPATDAMRIMDLIDPKADFHVKTPRDHLVRGTARLARNPLPPAGREGAWSIKMFGRGSPSTTAYSASVKPDGLPFIQASGYSATVDTTAGNEKWTIAPAASSLSTTTIYYYSGGKLRKLLGAVCNWALGWKAGGPVEYTFTADGLYQTPTDAATPGSPVFGTSVGPLAVGATISFAGNSGLIIREFSWASGNTMVKRPSVGATDGLAPPRVTTGKPTWKLVIEDPLVAGLDLEGLQKSATLNALSWTVGSVQYNKIAFATSGAVIEAYEIANDNGIPVATISGGCYDSSDTANDAAVVTFA